MAKVSQSGAQGGQLSSGQRKTMSKVSNSQQKIHGLISKVNTVGQASNNSIITIGSLDSFAIRGPAQPQPQAIHGGAISG